MVKQLDNQSGCQLWSGFDQEKFWESFIILTCTGFICWEGPTLVVFGGENLHRFWSVGRTCTGCIQWGEPAEVFRSVGRTCTGCSLLEGSAHVVVSRIDLKRLWLHGKDLHRLWLVGRPAQVVLGGEEYLWNIDIPVAGVKTLLTLLIHHQTHLYINRVSNVCWNSTRYPL